MEYKNKKVRKIKKTFWETMLLLTLKGKILFEFFETRAGTEPEICPKSEPQPHEEFAKWPTFAE
jgi:hypothetical protein